jgi:hypothetical protein
MNLSEGKFINKLYELIIKEKELGKHELLRKVYKNKNLSTKEFQDIWAEWWKGRLPPRTEVDIILAFEDQMEVLDKALIGCMEIEYFSIKKNKIKKNFYAGLQQILAFSIFGFDGLCLWHVFSPDIEENVIENYAKAMGELIYGYKLPIFYSAAKILDEKELRMISFYPLQLKEGKVILLQVDEEKIDHFINMLNKHWMKKENRNPRLEDNEVRNRRNLLKMLLKIPL